MSTLIKILMLMSKFASKCLYYFNFSTFTNLLGVCRHSQCGCLYSPIAVIQSNIYTDLQKALDSVNHIL